MTDKDSGYIDQILQYLPFLFALSLSCIGGAVSYLNKIDRESTKFNLFRFCVEIITSGFVGIVSFMLCDAASLDWSYTAAIVAISGHMGARALFLMENAIFINFLKRYDYGYENSKTETGRKKEADYGSKKPHERL